MVKTADLALVLNTQVIVAHVQVVESHMGGGKNQGENQCEPYEKILLGAPVECFVQHAVIFS